jgi:hypothetical protein
MKMQKNVLFHSHLRLIKGSPTYGILSIGDSHEATVVIGGVRVSGEILRRQDVEIDEPGSMEFN